MTYDPFRAPPAPSTPFNPAVPPTPPPLDFAEPDQGPGPGAPSKPEAPAAPGARSEPAADALPGDAEAAAATQPPAPTVTPARDVVVVRRAPRWVWVLPLWLLVGTVLGAVVEQHTGLLGETLGLGGAADAAGETHAAVPWLLPPRLDPIDLGLTDTSEALASALDFASASTVLISAHSDRGLPFGPAMRRPDERVPDEVPLALSLGAGIIYRVTDESVYVLTNHHVVENSHTVLVTLRGTFVTQAFFAAADPRVDLALLQIPRRDVPFEPPRAILADSSAVRPGHLVLAVGQPAGYRHTATLGIVSAIGRPALATGESPFVHYLQSSAPINRGNSGGPLIDLRGRVVGLNTWKVREAEGLGFALPANFVRRVADDLLEHGALHWPYMGVRLGELDSPARAQFGDGVWIEAVQPDSPAAEADIQPNDILHQIDRQRIHNTTDVYRALSKRRPGETAVLVLQRNRRELTRTVRLTLDPRHAVETTTGE